MPELNERDLRATVTRVINLHKQRPGPLLEILHGVQGAADCIPSEAVPWIADALNLSRAEVHGVVSFYHHFRAEACGRHTIRMCRAEACQSMGSRALEVHACQKLGIDFHGTSPNGAFTLEPVYCLGNCALSPAVMIGDELYGRVTPQRLDELITEWGDR